MSDPSTTEPTMPPSKPLTLILAATPSLGIGKNNDLPWPKLKKELAYFARVTKRTSSPAKRNAVLMGRKTWDSIPPKFRPLKGRVNVVVSRNVDAVRERVAGEAAAGGKEESNEEGPVVVASGILDAITQLSTPGRQPEIESVFVIGGASVYAAALELPQTRRVLLTKIDKEFECDTFFPLNLDEVKTWRRCERSELEEITGEKIAEREEEQGVGFEFCLFERVDG